MRGRVVLSEIVSISYHTNLKKKENHVDSFLYEKTFPSHILISYTFTPKGKLF